MLEQFLERTEFRDYEDFFANFKYKIPENFNFGYDVVDYLAENSYFKNNCTNNGLAVIYTAKFAENGKFAVDIAEAVSSKEDEIHTEKLYVYTYENSKNREDN